MKEDIRIKIVKKIEQLKEEKQKYLKLKKDLEVLSKNDAVKRYLEIVNALNSLERKKHILFNKNDDIINYCFQNSVYDNRKMCTHDIWVYIGSYYQEDDYERSYNIKVNNENNCKFEYNVYRCLECGDEFRTREYADFEKRHLVLKTYNNVDFYKLQKLYFKYLSASNQESVCKKMIKTFYQNN